jgi:hypothetical protein
MRIADQSREAGRSVTILFYWFAEDEWTIVLDLSDFTLCDFL